MRTRFILLATLATLAAFSSRAEAQQPAFRVVVHSSNPEAQFTARELSRVFRKDVTRWSDGSAIVPVDMGSESPVREAFSQRVHGKRAHAMLAYWQQQVFSGRAVPPVERRTDADVIDYVRTHPGAIGYVSTAAALPAEVKVVVVR